MIKLSIALVVIFISVSIAQSQSLKSMSPKKEIFMPISDESSSINLKLNYYFLFGDVSAIEHGYGFLSEFQLMTSRKFGMLFTANLLSLTRKDQDGLLYTKFGGLILTAGPKFYFNSSLLQGYASLGIGEITGVGRAVFTITPAIGLEYKISSGIKLNLETKSNFYATINGPFFSQFINAGIVILL